MKRCAILFAILIITLFIAVWAEQKHGAPPVDEVALEAMNSMQTAEAAGSLQE